MKMTCPQCHFSYDLTTKEKVNRTNPQNRYYWGQVVGIPASEIGYTPEELHEAYKWMFLKKSSDDHTKPPTVRSTASLTTAEFSEYIEKCRQWCAENGYVVPDPSEVLND